MRITKSTRVIDQKEINWDVEIIHNYLNNDATFNIDLKPDLYKREMQSISKKDQV